jgi:hypothetical protein
MPVCPEDQWIQRDGSCCPQCSACEDTAEKRCNWNDDPVCAKGFYTGDDCSTPVPPENRVTAEFTVTVCTNPTCIQFTDQQVKTALANKGQVPPEHITVETVSSDADKCCTTYAVTVADEKDNPEIDVDEAKNQIVDALKNDPSYKVQDDQGANAAVAHTLTASVVAVALGVTLFF